jgi:hypothetical protein
MRGLRCEPSFSRLKWKDALTSAGSLTRQLLTQIEPFIRFDRKYVLVDVQIQYLKRGHYTTNREGTSWHLDGATAVHPVLSREMGIDLPKDKGALDIDDTLTRKRKMRFFSVFFNDVSRTEYVSTALFVDAPKCIPSWEIVSNLIDAERPATSFQDDCVLTEFDDTVLHRATASVRDGWRYWIRIGEIDFLPRARDQHIDTVYAP